MDRTYHIYRIFFHPFAETGWFLPHFLKGHSLLFGRTETSSIISGDRQCFPLPLLCTPLVATLLTTLPVNASFFLLISSSEKLATAAAPGSDAQAVANGCETIDCILRHGFVVVMSEWLA